MDSLKKKHYFVIYTHGAPNGLKNLIEKYMPHDRGEVLVPCMEYYKRSEKLVMTIPIFPGYVFVYTDYNIKELHELLKVHRRESLKGFRELGFKENTREGGEELSDLTEEELSEILDLNPEEEEFLDFLRMGDGLLSMSVGYQDGKRKYVVMEGPLKAYENRIIEVDKHNRKAFLDFEINGRCVRAGFECKPKAYWFPKESSKLAKLSDGTEVDLDELKKAVMTI